MPVESGTGMGGSSTSIPTPSAPKRSTRRKEEDKAPTEVTTITGGLLGGVNLGTVPDYSPPATTTSGGGGGSNKSGGGGGSTSGGSGSTTTVPGGSTTTDTGSNIKSIYESLLPFLSPEDRQRLISSAKIQGIDLSVPAPSYSNLIGYTPPTSSVPYKVNPDYLVPSDTRKGINIKALVEGGNYTIPWLRNLIGSGKYYLSDPENAYLLEGATKALSSTTPGTKTAPQETFAPTDSGTQAGIPASNAEPSISDQMTSLSIIPTELKGSTRAYFAGAQRAEGITTALENMANAAGKTPAELGAGYRFLQEVANNLIRFSPASGPMSRQQYVELLGQLNPLLDNAPSGYGELGRMLALPFFSSGNLYNVAQNQAGQYLFGEENKRLFR